ncbi:hypothetical protein Pcinc_009746 [Petrolisthes cinctipes]|uniref:Uncharacterized protein n=1 Tax=Petrolisthes cinctipes TaxID=88211 RepID=A0AAE1KUG9_PETCI|nr:hypothetical protein Pcinc_009746 [Petrolisthes cinctipes]
MEHNINMACWKMRLQLLSTPCPVYSEHLLIVNGNFAIPSNDGKYDCFHKLIRGTLRVDASQRFKVWDILERLAAVAETKGVSRCKSMECGGQYVNMDGQNMLLLLLLWLVNKWVMLSTLKTGSYNLLVLSTNGLCCQP